VILSLFDDSKGVEMPAAVAVTRTGYTAVELRRLAARTNDGNAARRMLAIAQVLEGKTREEAAVQPGRIGWTSRSPSSWTAASAVA